MTARRGQVLVIDDDPMVARALARTLEQAHDVTVVGGAAGALALVQQGRRFDVIFCDLDMPGMNGIALYGALAPEVAARLVFLSGGAQSDEAISFLQRIPNRLIAKPFDVEGIRRITQERL